ncbi:MAG TPA: chemotaxis protein CheW [Conexibacter sp.]|nr:chemotaxis protein CheW [Conexibacter sp.]
MVVCALGAEEYGLPIEHVREIVRFSEPRHVASDVPWMLGVISLRGRLVPVHDLATRLGLVTSPAGEARVLPSTAKLVIVETRDEAVGVLVDDVVEVLTVDEAQLEPVPSGDGRIVRVGDRLVLLLDGEELAA